MPLRAVIFDFDGVIVDSEPLHYQAMRDALLASGITITPAEYEGQYLAYSDREAIRVALEVHGQPPDAGRVEALSLAKAQIFEELIARVALYSGARELIVGLARQMPLAIASGALRGEIERILTAAELRHHFRLIVGADDCHNGKPHPEPYQRALAGLRADRPDLQPSECLVFEDSMAGIAAGRAAGMKVVGVAHSYPAAKLGAAHRVVESLQGLDPASLASMFED